MAAVHHPEGPLDARDRDAVAAVRQVLIRHGFAGNGRHRGARDSAALRKISSPPVTPGGAVGGNTSGMEQVSFSFRSVDIAAADQQGRLVSSVSCGGSRLQETIVEKRSPAIHLRPCRAATIGG